MQLAFVISFISLFPLVLVWFGLCANLFRILRIRHPEKYSSMGSPTLFWRNSPATGFALLKFIWRREDRVLGDGGLSKLTVAMRLFFMIYSLIFLFTAISMFTTQGQIK